MIKNKLYYGDNLEVLQKELANESVDLIYIDPPFNSNRTYNTNMKGATAQVTAFEDTWSLKNYQEQRGIIQVEYPQLNDVMNALETLTRDSDPNMLGYLTFMAPRLAEMHRVLKSTGSIYVHCDDTASFYIRLLLVQIFGKKSFKNEIIWKRASQKNNAKNKLGRNLDHIFLFTKSENYKFYPIYTGSLPEKSLKEQYQYLEFPDGTTRRMTKEENKTQVIPEGARRYDGTSLQYPNMGGYCYTYKGYPYPEKGWNCPEETMKRYDREGRLIFPDNPNGRIRYKRYLDESKGQPIDDLWNDIKCLQGRSAESLGYPTQKPLALLERVINLSSQEGDVVLDAFCGCGTTIDAAQKLNRSWIGIDVTCIATNLIERRITDRYYQSDYKKFREDCDLYGYPKDLEGFDALCTRTFGDNVRKEAEIWAVTRIGGVPEPTKGADGGYDGYFFYATSVKDNFNNKGLISVKTGNIGEQAARDFNSVLDKFKCKVGVLVSRKKITKPMKDYIQTLPMFEDDWGNKHPKIIVCTVEELLNGFTPRLTIQGRDTIIAVYKKAKGEKPTSKNNQQNLL